MLTLSELHEIGVSDADIEDFAGMFRRNREIITHYGFDILLNGRNADYYELVQIIDDALIATESAYSSGRIDDFRAYSITDLIQTSLLYQMDEYRQAIKQSITTGENEPLITCASKLSLPENKRKPKYINMNMDTVRNIPVEDLQKRVFKFVSRIVDEFIPKLRSFSDNAINTTKLAGQVNYDKKPEDMMMILISNFLKENAEYFVLDLQAELEL